MTPWENHTLTKVFLSMVVYRKQTECVKMSSVLFTIRSQYPARKTDKYGTHTTDRLTILCVVRISYNTPNPSAIKLTGNKCLSWLPIPIIACISETRPFRLPVNWFPWTCLWVWLLPLYVVCWSIDTWFPKKVKSSRVNSVARSYIVFA